MKKFLIVFIVLMHIGVVLYAMPPKPGSGIAPPVFPKTMNQPNQLRIKPGEGRPVWNCLVILIDYTDTSPSHSNSSFDDMMFGSWSPGCVSDYYYECSYGQFSLTGIVVGWYEAANNKNYYSWGGYGIYGAYPHNAPRLVEEAVDAAQAAGVDFSLYDNDGDNEVESMFIVHQGPGAEETGSTGDIWSHQWAISYGGGSARYYDGVWINTYTIQPETHSDGSHIDIGVFCHEYGHALGLPDLYDYDSGSWSTINDDNDNPICDWCIMASGSWGNGDGSNPSHFCGWSRWELGWVTPTQVDYSASESATIFSIEEYENSGTTPSLLAVYPNNNPSSDQYFLLEYRRTETRDTRDLFDHYDSDYWSGPPLQLDMGLIIMHVDEDQPDGGGRWNDGSPSNSNYGIWVEAPGYNPAHAGEGFPEWTVNSSGTRYEIKTGAAFENITDQNSFGYNAPISSSGWYWANSRRYSGTNTNIELTNIGVADPVGGPTMSIDGLDGPDVSIHLTSFSATQISQGVNLSWRLESEYNTVEWLIERADNKGSDYEIIYSVRSKGNSPQPVDYHYIDRSIEHGKIYIYRLSRYDNIGNKIHTAISSVRTHLPGKKTVKAYPSIFSSKVTLEYSISKATSLSAQVYSVNGRLIRSFKNLDTQPGDHVVSWDGRDSNNREIPPGIYIFKLSTDEETFTEKIIKVK